MIRASGIMKKQNIFFLVYHTYFPNLVNSKKQNPFGMKAFIEDLNKAEQLGIDRVVIEDYWVGPKWGDYSKFVSKSTMKQVVKEIHDHRMLFLPYFCLTEVDTKSDVLKNIPKGIAHSHWHQPIPAFMSFLLPYYDELDFRSWVMCVSEKSPWPKYLLSQIQYVINQLDADGAYLDRADYRIRCFNKEHDCNGGTEFNLGLPNLVKKINNLVKSTIGPNGQTIINDSCIIPDPIAEKCFQNADSILAEVLPIDSDPYNSILRLYPAVAPIAWYFRHFLKPGIKIIRDFNLSSSTSVSKKRLLEIKTRLNKAAPGKSIIFFQHGFGLERLKIGAKMASSIGEHIGYFFGRNRIPLIFD